MIELNEISQAHLEAVATCVFVIVTLALSRFLKLRLENEILVASFRTGLQLSLIGYFLGWIFNSNSLFINLLILIVMTFAAAQAAVSRLKNKTRSLFLLTLGSLFISVIPLGLLTLQFILSADSLESAAIFIPYMGVLMGNTLSGVSLALIGLERIKSENQLEVETFQALGATYWEAHHRLYQNLFKNSLTPLLNGMTIVGLVSLPGVMAGQILGGTAPLTAARFQIFLMTLMLLSSALGVLSVIMIHHFLLSPAWRLKKKSTFLTPLNPHDRWFLTGPSGVGKSRLLKSCLELDEPEILSRHKSVLGPIKEAQSLTLYVPQRPYFVSGTVEENLRLPFKFQRYLGKSFNLEFAKSTLSELGLTEEFLKKEADKLSGGEAQIVHLVRSLQLNPEFLYLDEPTSSLDSDRTNRVEKYLKRWSENSKGFLMISHNPEQVSRLATRVLQM